MDQNAGHLALEVSEILNEEYQDIERITIDDEGILYVYAPDDTLWKIFEDNMGKLNLEFEAGADGPHFLRITVGFA